MKNIALPLVLFFALTSTAQAEYDSRKYLPEYVPYNYYDAVEMIDFDDCRIPLDKFDEAYFELEWKAIPGSDEGTIFYRYEETDPSGITSLNQLEDRVESEIRDCVSDYPDYIADKEEEQAKKLAELEAEEEAEERARQIAIALDRCDFEFFETLSTREKMQTYDERVACEEKANEPVSTPEPVEVVPISTPVIEPVVVEPVVPTYIPPNPVEVNPEPEVVEEEVSISAEATTTPETIEVTQEELDRMVEERMSEKLNEPEPSPEPEEKPSLFKRITNFLFGWMF